MSTIQRISFKFRHSRFFTLITLYYQRRIILGMIMDSQQRYVKLICKRIRSQQINGHSDTTENIKGYQCQQGIIKFESL